MLLVETPIAIWIVLAAAGAYLGVPWLYMRWLRRRLVRECRVRRCIAITFDDGPCARLTARIRDRLTAAAVPATFLVTGMNLRGNEGLLTQLLRDGHAIGSHGMRHLHHWGSTPWAAMADALDGLTGVSALRGQAVATPCFRPPYGKLNLVSLLAMLWRGVQLVPWTHDGGDARRLVARTPAAMVEALRSSGGGVVLLHDFPRDGLGEDVVIARVDALLALRQEGFRFVRVIDVLQPQRVDRPQVSPVLSRR